MPKSATEIPHYYFGHSLSRFCETFHVAGEYDQKCQGTQHIDTETHKKEKQTITANFAF